ncbi:hypothetical protein C0992_008943 [Termitomyces sp. T32_za158]|nr:hypothetical protein C0992_008943 [Termitomyces sp. T32_za158]
MSDEADSTSPIPVVTLDYDTITDSVAARLSISLIGQVLFLKSQIPLPIVQLSRLSSTKSTPRAIKQRSELLSSFDTLSSHLNTTFTALSSAFARLHNISNNTRSANSNHARAYMGIFVGSSPTTVKAKVIFAVDGLEIKVIGARDDITRKQGSEEDEDEDEDGEDEDDEEDDWETDDDSDDSEDDDDDDDEDDDDDDDDDGDDGDEDDNDGDENEDEDEDNDGDEDDEDDKESSLPPESRSPSPEPYYPSHAEQQRALQAAERLFSRTLAAADANGHGMSADLAPTQTHIMLRAPRRFVHPAWIPRQNLSATLEGALDEFLQESGIHNEDVQNTRPRKASKRGKTVEGVWVVGREGLSTALGKDTIRGRDEEWDEMIWWSWDGKIVGFSDW